MLATALLLPGFLRRAKLDKAAVRRKEEWNRAETRRFSSLMRLAAHDHRIVSGDFRPERTAIACSPEGPDRPVLHVCAAPIGMPRSAYFRHASSKFATSLIPPPVGLFVRNFELKICKTRRVE
jgi:hypothetical protein